MRRIIVISLILIVISGLAVANAATETKFNPRGYVLEFGSAKYIVITQLDRNQSVMIAGAGGKDQYMVEGILSRTIAQGVKLMAGEPSNDKKVKKFVSEMVNARQVSLTGDNSLMVKR